MFSFDRVVTARHRDGSVSFTFFRHPHRRSRLGDRRPQPSAKRVGELRLRFASGRQLGPRSPAAMVTKVEFTANDGLTPTDMQRFAWSKWFVAGDAVARGLYKGPQVDARGFPADQVSVAALAHKGIVVKPPADVRPGRAGHPDSHYKMVADLYVQFLGQGDRAPVKRIAEKLHYSPATVSGWITKARELGYLPPARQGKPG